MADPGLPSASDEMITAILVELGWPHTPEQALKLNALVNVDIDMWHWYRSKAAAAIAAVRPLIEAEAAAECDGCDQLRERMAQLLTDTAAALKGRPPPLTMHDWSDLPAVAAAVAAEAQQLREQMYQIRDRYDAIKGVAARVLELMDDGKLAAGKRTLRAWVGGDQP